MARLRDCAVVVMCWIACEGCCPGCCKRSDVGHCNCRTREKFRRKRTQLTDSISAETMRYFEER